MVSATTPATRSADKYDRMMMYCATGSINWDCILSLICKIYIKLREELQTQFRIQITFDMSQF
jgi:hypothetical protein